MARKLRLQFPGALYHIVNRGDRGDAIVRDDLDRVRFVETLEQAVQKTGWLVHAWCLLPDHFHLVVTTPKPNLVEGMKWFLGTYTARFNRRHEMGGHLFSGRYKSQVVDPELAGAPSEAALYLHRNPVRAALVPEGTALGDFRWSSYPEYLKPREQRVPWLSTDLVLRDAGCGDGDESSVERFRAWTESHPAGADDALWRRWRQGWYVGGDAFRVALLDRLHEQRDVRSTGLIWRASAEQQAERLVRRSLDTLGWSDQELGRRRKTDPEKLFIARQLRKETTMPLTWIAERLQMGSRNTLRNALASGITASSPFREPKATAARRPQAAPVELPPATPSGPSSPMTVDPGWD